MTNLNLTSGLVIRRVEGKVAVNVITSMFTWNFSTFPRHLTCRRIYGRLIFYSGTLGEGGASCSERMNYQTFIRSTWLPDLKAIFKKNLKYMKNKSDKVRERERKEGGMELMVIKFVIFKRLVNPHIRSTADTLAIFLKKPLQTYFPPVYEQFPPVASKEDTRFITVRIARFFFCPYPLSA